MLFSKFVAAAGLLASAQALDFDSLHFEFPSLNSLASRQRQPKKAQSGAEPSASVPQVATPSTKGGAVATGPTSPASPATPATPPGSCPAVWTTISKELTSMFRDGIGCNDNARAIIRGVFHDCFPQGGCDGSLAFPEELSRSENSPMTATINSLKSLATKYKVGVADMLMFAGSHAVVSCPGGPTTKTFIGRVDAKGACPPNQLPSANVSAADAKAHFLKAGFSSQDLAALVGAHTASRQFNTDLKKVGASQDLTPGIWDLMFYVQLIGKIAPFSFQSDINLLADADTGKYMRQFATNKGGWDAAFAPAFAKMQVLGAKFDQVDCTSALPKGLFKRQEPNQARSIINSLSMRKLQGVSVS